MALFRHKTIKGSFRLKLLAASVLNVGLLASLVWWWLRTSNP